jgi:Cu/Ag efflux pump CusA
VASAQIGPAPNIVRHEGGFRRIDIGTNVSGHDLGSVAREIQAKVTAIALQARLTPRCSVSTRNDVWA